MDGDIGGVTAGGDDHLDAGGAQLFECALICGANLVVGAEECVVHIEDGHPEWVGGAHWTGRGASWNSCIAEGMNCGGGMAIVALTPGGEEQDGI